MIVFTPNTIIRSADINTNFNSKTPVHSNIFSDKAATSWSNSTTTFTDITGWTNGYVTTFGNYVLFFVEFSYYRTTAGTDSDFRLKVGTLPYPIPGTTGFRNYTNELNSHKNISRTFLYSSLPAGTYAVSLQAANVSGGSVNVDSNDYLNIKALTFTP